MKSRLFKTRAGAELKVSEMGFGAAPLGDLFELIDERAAFDSCGPRRGGRHAVRHLSALRQRPGRSTLRHGAARPPRDSFVFSTKVGRVMDPSSRRPEGSDDVIRRASAAAPARLLSTIPMTARCARWSSRCCDSALSASTSLLIHDVDVWTHGDRYEKRFGEAMDGAYKALDELRRDGSSRRSASASTRSRCATRFATAGDFDTVLLAGRYSLLEQPALKTFMPLAVEGIGVILGGVFNSGILATGAVPGAKVRLRARPAEIMERVRRIEAVCAATARRSPRGDRRSRWPIRRSPPSHRRRKPAEPRSTRRSWRSRSPQRSGPT